MLLVYGGSLIGDGAADVGSVRVPSHYSGIYTVKASVRRFLKIGSRTNASQEGVAPVYSSMARTLEDLEYFRRAVMAMDHWKYYPSVCQSICPISRSGVCFIFHCLPIHRELEETTKLGCNVGRRFTTDPHLFSLVE